MNGGLIGVRWWLGPAFAVVAAVSTAIVVSPFSSRSENAFRVHASQLAVQSATLAAAEVEDADRSGTLGGRLPIIAQHFDLDLYVYGARGKLLGKAPARTQFAPAPAQQASALQAASLSERRAFMNGSGGVRVVRLPPAVPPRVGGVAAGRPPHAPAPLAIPHHQAPPAAVSPWL